MPQSLPIIPQAFINNLSEMNLREIAYATTTALIGDDISANTIKHIVDEALPTTLPLVRLDESTFVLELFNGYYTMSFKDVGMKFMAEMLDHLRPAEMSDNKLNVIVTTTGNTGVAVARALSHSHNTNVIILVAHSSDITAQLVSEIADCNDNIHLVEVAGDFDSCRSIANATFADLKFRQQLYITSANSTNIARIIPQVAFFYYLYGQLKASGANPDQTAIAIPSGNLSLITAGALARRMGLQTGRMIAACNVNNSFVDFVATGQMCDKKPTMSTSTPFIDIAHPANLPRLLSLYNHDLEALKCDIGAVAIDDSVIRQTVNTIFDSTGYAVDHHTAVAIAALGDVNPRFGVAIATANPLRHNVDVSRHLYTQGKPPTMLTRIPPSYQAFKKFLLSIQ